MAIILSTWDTYVQYSGCQGLFPVRFSGVIARFVYFYAPANERNISTLHIAKLLGATCCTRLATMLRRVAKCCDMLGVVGSNLKMVKFFMQHLWMLHDVVVVWPGYTRACTTLVRFSTRNMPQHVTTWWPKAGNMLH